MELSAEIQRFQPIQRAAKCPITEKENKVTETYKTKFPGCIQTCYKKFLLFIESSVTVIGTLFVAVALDPVTTGTFVT